MGYLGPKGGTQGGAQGSPPRENFMDCFVALNIINFADITREKDRVSWNVRRISSP